MHSILIADPIPEIGKAMLREKAEVLDCPEITIAELLQEIPRHNALIIRSRTSVTRELLMQGRNLQVVGRMGVGVDNIDLESARELGIQVVNSPTATTIAVAELTLALMLDLARMTPQADVAMKQGEWAKKALRGTELFGKTLGIIGIGRIGQAVAKRASGFGMRVIGVDTFLTPDRILERGAKPASLEEILAESDYISIHVPLNEDTRGLINRETIGKMKDGVRIICAARGGIILEADLLEGLNAGKVAGAGLDVFEVEPPGAIPLVSHPRVVTTPHIGAQTVEAQDRAAVDIASEVLRALNGEALRWRVV